MFKLNRLYYYYFFCFFFFLICCRIDCNSQRQSSRQIYSEKFTRQLWATNCSQHRHFTRQHSTTAHLKHYCTNLCVPPARKISESNKMKCEFRRLPGDVVPQHYDLELKPCLASFTFDGRTSVQIKVRIRSQFFLSLLPLSLLFVFAISKLHYHRRA